MTSKNMEIRMFTTPDCPFSKMARELLREHNVEFEDNNILEDKEARAEMMRISQQMAVPVIEIREAGKEPVIIRGFKEEELKKALHLGE